MFVLAENNVNKTIGKMQTSQQSQNKGIGKTIKTVIKRIFFVVRIHNFQKT